MIASLVLTTTLAIQKPNIIFIITDDLGYGDIGVTWQNQRTEDLKFATPSIDTLANEGMTLTRHYCPAPVCAPSRASLFTGLHQGHPNLRNTQFDKVVEDNHNIATTLKQAGYTTTVVGKWGIAGAENQAAHPGNPVNRGFDEFFGYLFHADGHEHYPQDGTTDKKAFLYEGTQKISQGVGIAYTADLFTARAKHVIKTQTQSNPQKPFFLYLSYDTPHFKMQVPSAPYPEFRPQQNKDALTGGIQWTGPQGTPPFVNTATGKMNSYFYPEHPESWPRSARIHATMVKRIDDSVGDILQLLKDLNIDKNTLVVFTSDNGPHNEGNNPRHFESYANMDGIKRDVWEAGIRVPTFARWPKAIPANSRVDIPSQFHDWLPTLADAARQPIPARTDGVSLLPVLTQKGQQAAPLVYIEYAVGGKTPNWKEFHSTHRDQPRGQAQVLYFQGYKGIRTNIQSAEDDFRIYDTLKDPKETNNLAPKMQELNQRMKLYVRTARLPNASAPRPYIDNLPMPAFPNNPRQPGIYYRFKTGNYPYPLAYFDPALSGNIPNYDSLSILPQSNPFAANFEGTINAPQTGKYKITLQTNGKALLKLSQNPIIDTDYNKPEGTSGSYTINLEKGNHPYTIHYITTGKTPPKITLTTTQAN